MHIGAWQEYKLYKILVLRENYRQNGLYQLSKDQDQLKPQGKSVPGGSHASTVISNSEKTTATEGKIQKQRQGRSDASKISSSIDRRVSGPGRPTAVLKNNYDQWIGYEKAKERATKDFLEDFAPPPIPMRGTGMRRPPIPKKKEKKAAKESHKDRIEKMRVLYNIKKKQSEEQKNNDYMSNLPKLPPIVTPKKEMTEKFNSEYTVKVTEEKKAENAAQGVVEEVKASEVDEHEVDNLLQWAQALPEEISSSFGGKKS